MLYRIKQNNDELFHSDDYLGMDLTRDLKHWKYIDKYKSKTGKWVYVYKKTGLKDVKGENDTQAVITSNASHHRKLGEENETNDMDLTIYVDRRDNTFNNDEIFDKFLGGRTYGERDFVNRHSPIRGIRGIVYYRDLKTGKYISEEDIEAAAKWVRFKLDTKKKVSKMSKELISKGKDFVKNLLRIH